MAMATSKLTSPGSRGEATALTADPVQGATEAASALLARAMAEPVVDMVIEPVEAGAVENGPLENIGCGRIITHVLTVTQTAGPAIKNPLNAHRRPKLLRLPLCRPNPRKLLSLTS